MNKYLLGVLGIILLMLLTPLANATGGYLFASGGVSASAIQSKTNTGVNLEARIMVMTFNAAIGLSQLNDQTIANIYGGIGLPVWFITERDYMFVYLNLGTGTKGLTNKAGLQFRLDQTLDMPIGFTLSREIYKENPNFDNTQLGVTYYFD